MCVCVCVWSFLKEFGSTWVSNPLHPISMELAFLFLREDMTLTAGTYVPYIYYTYILISK